MQTGKDKIVPYFQDIALRSNNHIMKIPPLAFSTDERIAMGVRCRDCDTVPKVADAGMVFEDTQGRSLQIMHNGLRVLAGGYYGLWMTNLIRLCRGHHEAQEERMFYEVTRRLPDDATMIELGGFWSYYSLWFLKDHAKRESIVLEPEPSHLDVGRANAWLNGLSPEFRHGFAGGSPSPAERFFTEVSGEMTLPRYSVEQLMGDCGWPKLSLLHCDIQGAELEVLESCREMFAARRVEWVFVSTHAHTISGDPLIHQRCLQLLRDCGAVIEAEHEVHESFSGDGLIVARFCAAPPDWVPVTLSHNRHSEALFRSLAYDLDECVQQKSALQVELAARPLATPLHPSLTRCGTLLELVADGPLGRSGDSLLVPYDRVMSPEVMQNAAWDLQNIDDFVEHISPSKAYTLVDIGANVGLFTRQLALRMPDLAKVFCVEPDRSNFQALRYNLHMFGDKVAFHNIALGDTDGEREFFRDSENIGNYSFNPDAMRSRSHETVRLTMRKASSWMAETLSGSGALLWKSDTQGFDEVIVAATPLEIWRRIDVALIEVWRIAKPDFDRDAFRQRLEDFPHRQLGEAKGVTPDEILEYLSGDDWEFKELLMWR